ncbi:putative polysaccharide biosynthesis protein [Clostridium formicaceticum]|uniref:Polysaccharide biosynthesis protein n=1 Tax=Clostridium formicaceticum TaxID=1497 RepID=A0AAC9RGM5_9CLOT|nr:polysaccharide biosynthesis protein [Clostridium formicaceticum]AOY76196.1 polysaccharide biosynthesis protein [Clostridium formicaceticum]ARE86571.1 Stage V sporulation protein B [Clostridium formicaceticum]
MSNSKFIKGAFILGIAGLTAKFLGIFFKIPLQRLIHDEGMGLFGLPYPIYTMMLSVSIIGLPAAVSKLISEKIAVKDYAGVRKVFHVSFFMIFFIGIFSSCFLYFGAPFMITILEWPQETYYAIIGLSLAPFFVSIMSSFRGYFQGMQIMIPTALSQIIEQIGRVVIGVGLAYMYIDKGIGYAAGAASFGATAGAFFGALLLLFYYLKKRKSLINYNLHATESSKEKTIVIVKRLVWLAIPITIGAVLSSVMGLMDSIIVPGRLLQGGYTSEGATILYGRLTGKAVTLMNVPLTFSMAMAASLVPAISEANSKKNRVELKEKTETGIKVTLMIALPATIGLALLASPIIHLLWGRSEAGGDILKVLSLNVLFISIAQTLTSILQGMNKVFIPVRNLFIGVIIKVIVSYILLVGHLNIIGAVIGSLCGYGTLMILNYYEIKKTISFKLSIKEVIIKPLLCTTFMAIVVIIVFDYSYLLFQNEAIATLVAIFWGIIFYGLMMLLTNTVGPNKKDFSLNK